MTTGPDRSEPDNTFDPVDLAVLSNRLDGIVRDMENTLLRTARSSVIGLARDFSCSIVTRDDELLASAEGLPVHVFGSGLLTRSMRRHHPEPRPGDGTPPVGGHHHEVRIGFLDEGLDFSRRDPHENVGLSRDGRR